MWDELYPAEQARILRLLIERIDVAPDGISVTLHSAGIRSLVAELADQEFFCSGRLRTVTGGCRVMAQRADLELDTLTIRSDPAAAAGWPEADHGAGGHGDVDAEAEPRRDPDQALVRAHRWRRKIESGHARSITDLAEQEGVTDAYVCRLLPLTCLAPDLVEAIFDGRQRKGLRLAEMLGNGPVAWEEQRSVWVVSQSAISCGS